MDAKELAITIAGLLATFLMPWPGEADRPEHRAAPGALHARTSPDRCGETVLARLAMRPEVPRAEALQREFHAGRSP